MQRGSKCLVITSDQRAFLDDRMDALYYGQSDLFFCLFHPTFSVSGDVWYLSMNSATSR